MIDPLLVVQENAGIFDAGRYVAPSGAVVELRAAMEAACTHTRLYRPDEVGSLLSRASSNPAPPPRIEITAESTGEAGRRLGQTEGGAEVVALNFASARNPGGGYLKGSLTQEEQLCRTSGLYPCLLRAPVYYAANRASRSLLYTDHAIYSPKVPFFRTEAFDLEERPFELSVITSPAPQAGSLRREQPDLEDQLEPTLRARSGHVLAIARAHQHRTLLLGAWGCGAYGNDPEVVADAFGTWLEGPHFQGAFDRVVFAIFTPRPRDARNLQAFRARFPTALVTPRGVR